MRKSSILLFLVPLLLLLVGSCDETKTPTEPGEVQPEATVESATPNFDKGGIKPSKASTGFVGVEVVFDGPRHGSIAATGFATCPEGKTAIAGGYQIDGENTQDIRVIRNHPMPLPREWVVGVVNRTDPFDEQGFDLTVYALCVVAE